MKHADVDAGFIVIGWTVSTSSSDAMPPPLGRGDRGSRVSFMETVDYSGFDIGLARPMRDDQQRKMKMWAASMRDT